MVAQNILEDSLSMEGSEIRRFFKGTSILVTGGTGFLGKVLIEKLLHSCPELNTIFVLLRGKKEKSVEERMKELLQCQVFENLPGEWSSRLQAVEGELGVPDMGMSQDTRNLLIEMVDVVIHCAATVRFNEKLKTAIKINVQGTADIVSLCKKMDHLKSLVYVSTAFSHCDRRTLGTDEKFYPPGLTPETAFTLANYQDDDNSLDVITPVLLKRWPNTYTFTKAIAEEVVRQEAHGLPVAIFRPGMVVGTTSASAAPGFIDNLYGPTGFVVGIGYGIIKTFQAHDDYPAILVPADLCINGMIAAAWKAATTKFEEPPIYNFVPSPDNSISWKKLLVEGMVYGHTVPIPDCMWYNTVWITQSAILHKILWFFLHIVPSILLDTFLLASGEKPKMFKAHRKIDKFIDAVQYFGMYPWTYGQQNTRQLVLSMSRTDREVFDMDMEALDWNSYFKTMIDGIRFYLLKHKTDSIPECRVRYNRLKKIHYIVKYTIIFLMVCLAWTLLRCFHSIISEGSSIFNYVNVF